MNFWADEKVRPKIVNRYYSTKQITKKQIDEI